MMQALERIEENAVRIDIAIILQTVTEGQKELAQILFNQTKILERIRNSQTF